MSTFLVSTNNGQMRIKAKTSGSSGGYSYYLDISSTLLFWYNFSNVNGTLLQNSAPNIPNNGYDGTFISNQSVIVPNGRKQGKNSAYYDGTTYTTLPSTFSISAIPSKQCTFTLWSKPASSIISGGTIIMCFGPGGPSLTHQLNIAYRNIGTENIIQVDYAKYDGGINGIGDNDYLLRTYQSDAKYVAMGYNILNWNHYVVTVSTNISLYVNGIYIASQSLPLNQYPASVDASWNYIAATTYGNYFGKSTIYVDDVRVYSSVLSQTDISNLYNFTK